MRQHPRKLLDNHSGFDLDELKVLPPMPLKHLRFAQRLTNKPLELQIHPILRFKDLQHLPLPLPGLKLVDNPQAFTSIFRFLNIRLGYGRLLVDFVHDFNEAPLLDVGDAFVQSI